MSTEYGERLKAARKHARMTQAKLSAKTGIAESTISTAEREGYGSADSVIYAKYCGVDAFWLTTGEGEMIRKTDSKTTAPAITELPYSKEAIELAHWLDKVSPEIKDKVQAAAMHLITVAVSTGRVLTPTLEHMASDSPTKLTEEFPELPAGGKTPAKRRTGRAYK